MDKDEYGLTRLHYIGVLVVFVIIWVVTLIELAGVK